MYIDNPIYLNDIEKIAQLDIDWGLLKHSSILITGATGMIGTVLVDTFMKRNVMCDDEIHIYAMGRSYHRAQERFGTYLNSPLFTFITRDINAEGHFDYKVDYLFHCASNTHPRLYAEDPVGTIMTNVIGTDHVLQIARESNAKRVVFLSSVEIYGENRGDVKHFDETYCGYIDCNTMRAGYPEGKRTGEALCQAYREKFGLDIVIPRICRVFGPTMLESDSKALAQFIKNAVRKEDIVLKSEGNQYFSYCYVCDVAAALLYIVCKGANGAAYNVSDKGSDIRLKDLAKMLADIAGTKVVFRLPDTVESQGFSKMSISLLENKNLLNLGWKPFDSLRSNLQKTVTLYRENLK